ncbi:peptidyl-prolyl cis-trans isomerase FKBP18, chloroplastic isoform X2 [Humulus lupulus]|uniref:peptidyl-prolyl cis-trans isomerase FKBP18, chloroplastic isoform X2 n=1 Tax=Humulus lupulus TaxID=3486 RepID=UPI002B409385|nr:peptidyl-prolyl cis-trans isomerase FKBP18, chloroplastic isoform X2 [Humulus lupulus]
MDRDINTSKSVLVWWSLRVLFQLPTAMAASSSSCSSLRCLNQRMVKLNFGNFESEEPKHVVVSTTAIPISISISRRCAILAMSSVLSLTLPMGGADARERRSRKTIPPEDYLTSDNGLKYYDVVEGKGPVAENGSTVQVHFDCLYRGITALSSRESKLLAGNRAIAQPYEFKVGDPPGKERKRNYVDNPNGLFSAQASPKPPPALYTITQGMKVGGKRAVIVPPELGYGNKGSNEIPPGATFELNIELLQVNPTQDK